MSGGARSRLLVAALAVTGCARELPLSFSPVDRAQCAAFCADQLRVEVDGVATTHPCGEPIELDPVPPGEVVELVVTTVGAGIPLRGRVELTPVSGDEAQLPLALEPTARPVVDRVVPRFRRGLLGEAVIEIEGRSLGDTPGVVRVGGAPVELLEGEPWTAERVVARTPRVGEVVIERCGVESAPVDAGLYEPVMEALRPIVTDARCPDGRMVGASALDLGTTAQPFALFDCGPEACGATSTMLIGRLPREGRSLINFWRPEGTCPRALAQYEERGVYLADAGPLARCGLTVGAAGGPLRCARLARTPTAAIALSTEVMDAAYAVAPGAAGARALWLLDGAIATPILADQIPDTVALEGRYVLGQRGDDVAVHLLQRDRIAASFPVPDCTTPLGLAVRAPWEDASPTVLVACAGQAHVFDLTQRRDAPVARFALAELEPGRVALTVEGDRALVWDQAGGRLAFFDLPSGREVARLALEPTATSMALVRAARSDVFYLGGPRPGDVRRLDLDAEAP